MKDSSREHLWLVHMRAITGEASIGDDKLGGGEGEAFDGDDNEEEEEVKKEGSVNRSCLMFCGSSERDVDSFNPTLSISLSKLLLSSFSVSPRTNVEISPEMPADTLVFGAGDGYKLLLLLLLVAALLG